MALWKVETQDEYISFGDRRRRRLYAEACNEPFKDFYWCPTRKWFMKSPCPFVCRLECDNFKHMCGAI